jgi:hypothetical protein
VPFPQPSKTSSDFPMRKKRGVTRAQEAVVEIISTDPGKQHCAAVRYDCKADCFTHAALLNLLCRCNTTSGDREGDSAPSSGRSRKRRATTAFEFAPQLLYHFDAMPELFDHHNVGGGYVLAAVERQNARDTGNMVAQAIFQTRYGSHSELQWPIKVKRFWNAAVRAVPDPQPPAFRLTGSHTVNKTDAKRFARRFLTVQEMELFRRAAEENSMHKLVCPFSQPNRKRARKQETSGKTKNKKKKKKRTAPPPKMDDLFDAAMQAIYAYHTRQGIPAEDSEGPALKRIKYNIAAELEAGEEKGKKSTTTLDLFLSSSTGKTLGVVGGIVASKKNQ